MSIYVWFETETNKSLTMIDNAAFHKELRILQLEEELNAKAREANRLEQEHLQNELKKVKLMSQLTTFEALQAISIPKPQPVPKERTSAEATKSGALNVKNFVDETQIVYDKNPSELQLLNACHNTATIYDTNQFATAAVEIGDKIEITARIDTLGEQIQTPEEAKKEKARKQTAKAREAAIVSRTFKKSAGQASISKVIFEDSEDFRDKTMTDAEQQLFELPTHERQLAVLIMGSSFKDEFIAANVAKSAIAIVKQNNRMIFDVDHSDKKGRLPSWIYNPENALWEYDIKAEPSALYLRGLIIKAIESFKTLTPIGLTKEQWNSNIKSAILKLKGKAFVPTLMDEMCTQEFLEYHRTASKKMDSKLGWISCNDGTVVNPKTGEIRDRLEEDYFTECIAAHIDHTSFPLLQSAVDKIFCHDKDKETYALGKIGVALEGGNGNDIYVWFGKGHNGKSMLLDLVYEMIGKRYKAVNGKFLHCKKNITSDDHTASLKGVQHANILRIQETTCAPVDESKLKLLVRNKRGVVRGVNENIVEYDQNYTPIIDTNIMLNSSSSAVWDRLKIVKFNARFEKPGVYKRGVENLHLVDMDMLNKLSTPEGMNAYFTKIFNHAYAIHNTYGDDWVPEVVIEDTEDSQCITDIYQAFLDDCTEVAVGQKVEAKDVYARYANWCVDKLIISVSMAKFAREMTNKDIGRSSSNSKSYYTNLRLV